MISRCNFKIGQKVACILEGPWQDVAGLRLGDQPGPKLGDVVQIVGMDPSGLRIDGVELVGLLLAEWPGRWYVHCDFAPLREQSTETGMATLRGILDKVPSRTKVREDA